MKGKSTIDEGQKLAEADIGELQARIAETDAEVAKFERRLEIVAQRVAGEDFAVRQGRVGAEARRQTAVSEAGKVEARLGELRLVQKGLKADLAGLEARQRKIRETQEAKQAERQRQEYAAFVERGKGEAELAVQNAIEAYESAAVALGAAVGSFETLCSKCGSEGHYQAGRLIDSLLAGVQPSALEKKNFAVVRQLPRAGSPHGALEFRLLPVRVASKTETLDSDI
jgi:hypothetical protein